MIRKLAPDELPWFLSRSYAFLRHPDPIGFGARLGAALHDPLRDAERSWILLRDGRPVAGAHAVAPGPDDDDRTLHACEAWYDEDAGGRPDDLAELLARLLERFPHDAFVMPLHAAPQVAEARLAPVAEKLGLEPEEVARLRFELSEVPPLGLPLVLEAWTPGSDAAFLDVVRRAEGRAPGERRWSWWKRRTGRFAPDLWFLVREALDQEPVGYALGGQLEGAASGAPDAAYELDAVGVLAEHRGSTEMLRRLVLSVLHEYAARSPFGRVGAELPTSDPKLLRILVTLGFEERERYRRFQRLP